MVDSDEDFRRCKSYSNKMSIYASKNMSRVYVPTFCIVYQWYSMVYHKHYMYYTTREEHCDFARSSLLVLTQSAQLLPLLNGLKRHNKFNKNKSSYQSKNNFDLKEKSKNSNDSSGSRRLNIVSIVFTRILNFQNTFLIIWYVSWTNSYIYLSANLGSNVYVY